MELKIQRGHDIICIMVCVGDVAQETYTGLLRQFKYTSQN